MSNILEKKWFFINKEEFMKKTIIFGLAVLLAANGFAGGKKETPGESGEIKVGFVYDASIHDQGFSEAHDKGRIALEKLGYKTAYVENVAENADCEKAIRDLIDQGCNVIYTTSFGFMDWTLKVAEEFPNIKFAHCSGYKRAANMSTFYAKIYQAWYLAGIAAGYKTKSGKLGYVAAFPIPEVIRHIDAWALGAQSVDPNITVDVIWANTWNDPSVERQAATELLNRGCDVITHHQSTAAALLAGTERGAAAVGYAASTPDIAGYLTAPMFNWEAFYVEDVEAIKAQTWSSRAYWKGLEANAVSLDALTAANDSGAAAAIKAAQDRIASGSFDPFTGPIADQTGTVKIPAGSTPSDDELWNLGWFVKGINGTIN
jgi:basic membrane protein A